MLQLPFASREDALELGGAVRGGRVGNLGNSGLDLLEPESFPLL